MDLSATSSEDECDLYVNAASKLNALKHSTGPRAKDDDDEDDDDMLIEESNDASSVENCKTIEKEVVKEDEIEYIEDDNEDEIIPTNTIDDVITCIVDDDDENHENETMPVRTTRSGRRTRNSNKNKSVSNNRKSIIPPSLETPLMHNDSIERELNDTYNDSLGFSSQEENDSYVVIGSPPPAKKTNTDDYEVSVKVLWKSKKIERFEVKRNETFQKIFLYFSNLEKVHEDQILITKKDKRITPFDTPISIDWSILDTLDGGVVSAEIARRNKTNSTNSELQVNACKIKIQTSDKRTLTIDLKNDETFAKLLKKCSKELDVPQTKIKLYFDGELIDEDETPESLDIDEEACVDLKILN